METPRIHAYDLLRDMSEEIQSISYKRQVVTEEYKGMGDLVRNSTAHHTASVGLEFVQMNIYIGTNLSRSAVLFLIQNIMPNLKRYNLLWHWPPTKKSQEKIAMKELADKRIVFRTEVSGIYVVNPVQMWRGTIHSCVRETKQLLAKNGKKPTLEMIHDLKPSKKYSMSDEDMYHIIGRPTSTGGLLFGASYDITDI